MSPIAAAVVPSSNPPIKDPGVGSSRVSAQVGKERYTKSRFVAAEGSPAVPVGFMLGDCKLKHNACVYMHAYMPSQAHAMRWHMFT